MRLVLAVGEHHRFVVVDESEAGAQKMVLQDLELQTARDGETEVDLLEVLLGDVQRFFLVPRVGAEFVVDRVDSVLEVFALFEA